MRPMAGNRWGTAITLIVLAGLFFTVQAEAGRRSDAWITMKSKMALLTADDVDAMDINVDTVRGRVALHGKVSSEREKSKAERVVRKIDGVRNVQNLLQVMASESEKERVEESDENIEEAVERAFESRATLKKNGITVRSVNDGVVLLGGEAISMSAYLTALQVARGVRGVRYVASQVKTPETLSDDEVWQESAGGEREGMTESGTETGTDAGGDLAAAMNDLWTTSSVKMRLVAAEDVPAMDIHVDTRDGAVTLFGVVESAEAKATAEAEARKVRGVQEVRNELEVVPAERREVVEVRDEELEREVKHALRSEKGLDSAQVRVQVENRVVRLTGTTDSQTDRLAAAYVARSVAGVRSVKNDLRVEGMRTAD